MPKKTKKEKIITELRRKLEAVKVPGGERVVRIDNEKLINPLISTPTPSPLTTRPTTYNPSPQLTSYITKDLRKTFILAGLAISFELVVYWLTELGGSKISKFLPIR